MPPEFANRARFAPDTRLRNSCARSLVVLHDDRDLRRVEQIAPEALGAAAASPCDMHPAVLAFDTEIHLTLLERGIAHHTPWDFVSRDDYAALAALRDTAWKHWHTNAFIPYDGFNLLGLAAFRHFTWICQMSWALFALHRAIEALRPARVFAFDEGQWHGLDQPHGPRRMPALCSLAAAIAEERGLAVTPLPRSPEDGFRDEVAARNARTLPPINPQELRGGDYVLMCGSGAELIRQKPLADAIERQLSLPVVQIYKYADEQTLAAASDGGRRVWHESQVLPPARPPEIGDIRRDARKRFDADGRTLDAQLRPLFAGASLRPHYDFLFGEYAARMAGHVRGWKRWLAAYAPAALVVNYQMPLLDVATKVGVPSLVLPHWLLALSQPAEFTTLPPGATIGAISELHASILRRAGIAADRIHPTGEPWAASLSARAETLRTGARRSGAAALADADGRRTILVCTGSFGIPSAATHLPVIDWSDAVRQARRLGALAARRPEWAFVLKRHPRFEDYPRLYAEVNRALPADRQLLAVEDADLLKPAAAADVVCVWNAGTSAIVEASLVGRPVILCLPSAVWLDAKAWGLDAWPWADDVDALDRELVRLFADAEHYAARVRQTQAAVRRFLGDNPAGAAQRCAAVVGRWVSNRPVEAAVGDRLGQVRG